MVNLAHSEDLADPLSRALQPPLNETQEQRAAREAKEADAKRVSDRIDEQIRAQPGPCEGAHAGSGLVYLYANSIYFTLHPG